MKKYLVFVLMFLPMVSFAAPSVRMLGSKTSSPSSSSTSTVKVTPTKTTSTNAGTASNSRIGTLRAKANASGTVSTAASTNSRFPVISSTHSYSAVTKPQSSGTTVSSVNKEEIVNEVMQNVEAKYYDKDQSDANYYNKKDGDVYTTNEFKDAVKETMDEVDDPRIDAIKIGSKPVHDVPLPEGYVYMWIEDN